jgi:hypothetical protein
LTRRYISGQESTVFGTREHPRYNNDKNLLLFYRRTDLFFQNRGRLGVS